VTGSSVLSKWYGESEANVRRLFEDARAAAPAVIFIDEVDSLLGRRSGPGGDGPGGASEASRRVTNEFLSYIDGIHTGAGGEGAGVGGPGGGGGAAASAADAAAGRVVVIAATNAPWELDEAALSRFAARVLVPLPDARARADIIRAAMAGVACDMGDAEWRRVAEATASYSGRDLMGVCREASMRPLRELWGNRVLEGGAPRHAQRHRQLVTAVAAALRRGVPRRRMRRELEKWKRAEGAAAWCDVDAVIAEAEAANSAREGAKPQPPQQQRAPPSPPPPPPQPKQQAAVQGLQQELQVAEAAKADAAGAPTVEAAAAPDSSAAATAPDTPAAAADPSLSPSPSGGMAAAAATAAATAAAAAAGAVEEQHGGGGSGRPSTDAKDTWTVEELLSLPADALRPVVVSDFEAALQAVSPSECELAAKFEEWSAKYGSGGATKRREDAWRSMPMYL
jgi:SpoVK/Ycf46/Vps4 family AAA+-type ATPase